MTPTGIAEQMIGVIGIPGLGQAFLPSPAVQNHAAFLARLPNGDLACAWFGGSLEGKSDISIHASVLDEASQTWSPSVQLTDLTDRSEQNPVLFVAPEGDLYLFNTAQPAGNQDESCIFMRRVGTNGSLRPGTARDIGLPPGTFIRAAPFVRNDGAWVLPLFLCNPRKGARWTGAHDTAAIAVSEDGGRTWAVSEVPDSVGSVHMTPIDLGNGQMAAFYRRRQADWVHRSESNDGGRTWSPPAPTDVPNNNSSIGAARLADGTIALVCNSISAAQSTSRRASLYDELEGEDARPEAADGCAPIWGVERAPLVLCLSRDGGKTFPERHVIETSSGTCLSNDSLDGRNKELSYPALLPGPDGGLDIAYTFYRRAIKHMRLSAEALADMRRIGAMKGTDA